MEYKASVEIDVEDAFNDLRTNEQQSFIENNLEYASDNSILEEAKRRNWIEDE